MKKGVHFHEKKRKFSFEKKENPMMRFDVHRILSVRKMNTDEKNNRDINREIDAYFFSPEKYFQKNSPVTVGKKIYLLDMNDPRLRRRKKLKTEKKLATNLFNNLVNYNKGLGQKYENSILNKSISNIKGKEYQNYLEMSSKFEIIDNDRLKMIFNSFKINDHKDNKDNSLNDKSQLSSLSDTNRHQLKEVKKSRKTKYPITLIERIPKDIKNSLFLQNRKLNLHKLSEKQKIHMSHYLSKKLNKPQNNLLLNRVDSFRFKKEVINEIENSKPIEEQYGKFKWNISLRRPEHFQGVRDSYINLKGERFLPFWSIVIERSPKLKELSLKPGHILNQNDINELKKTNQSTNNRFKNNHYFKTVENLEDLNIEGKNLFNIEYKREIVDSKNKKILHKVFMENGKAISSSDINSLFGHNTFYKDYSGCKTEKNIDIKEKFFRDKF